VQVARTAYLSPGINHRVPLTPCVPLLANDLGWLAQTLIFGVCDFPRGLVGAPARQQKAAHLTKGSALRLVAGASSVSVGQCRLPRYYLPACSFRKAARHFSAVSISE
jgi:hypothetical protein